jgi:hypothetical protein
LIGPQNRVSSGASLTSASICGTTFTISARGCTTPAFMPSRMLPIMLSTSTGMRLPRASQFS